MAGETWINGVARIVRSGEGFCMVLTSGPTTYFDHMDRVTLVQIHMLSKLALEGQFCAEIVTLPKH